MRVFPVKLQHNVLLCTRGHAPYPCTLSTSYPYSYTPVYSLTDILAHILPSIHSLIFLLICSRQFTLWCPYSFTSSRSFTPLYSLTHTLPLFTPSYLNSFPPVHSLPDIITHILPLIHSLISFLIYSHSYTRIHSLPHILENLTHRLLKTTNNGQNLKK